ncbi:MAG: hypothetical protein IKQ49_01325 [Eubacterium sp.]|nr:hypothetical protein [Eubacterium sp.]
MEEQEKNNVQVDPKEKAIADEIKNAVEQKYVTDSYKYGWCRSRYGKELTAAGCKQLNEEDFSGSKSCPSAQSSCALKQKMASGSFFQMIRRSNIAD